MSKLIAIRINHDPVNLPSIAVMRDENGKITKNEFFFADENDRSIIFGRLTPETVIFDNRASEYKWKALTEIKESHPAPRIKRFKLKDGLTLDDLKTCDLKEGNLGIENTDHYMVKFLKYKGLKFEISIYLTFSRELYPWNDFDNVEVLDEDFLQPYTPFYGVLKDQAEGIPSNGFQALNWVIHSYNEYMSHLPFLEEIKTKE